MEWAKEEGGRRPSLASLTSLCRYEISWLLSRSLSCEALKCERVSSSACESSACLLSYASTSLCSLADCAAQRWGEGHEGEQSARRRAQRRA